MIKKNELETIKSIAPFIVNSFTDGGIFHGTDLQYYTWKIASQLFDTDIITAGEKFDPIGAESEAIATGKVVSRRMQDQDGDFRGRITSFPVYDGDIVVGTLSIIQRMVHPLLRGLTALAPLLTGLFPEGAFIWAGDLKKMTLRFSSEKFDVPMFHLGQRHEDEKVFECIRTKKPLLFTVPEEQYGLPILSSINPIFDEEDGNTVVGVYGMILPKRASYRMRKMAETLAKNTVQMASVLEQLAASAERISENGNQLNNSIKEIFGLSENINEVIGFVKQIADQTKLLGLNAAIEAARAGSVGRGFGVVATEIRKLSDESKTTVNRIIGLTGKIMEKVTETNRHSEATMLSSAEQASATQEVTASIQTLTGMTQKLRKYAGEL
ncbi:MAG TPA: methyl-accepting chemotaxis protein [Spirochaetia bacterium]|nr:methyl-accepting chemotaxis protein [Spirochaetia bacterium]